MKKFYIYADTTTKELVKAIKRKREIIIKEENINSDVFEIIKIYQANDYKEKLNLIYDYVESYIENDMKINNYCDFEDNKCIANRLGISVHKINGCCYHAKEGLCKYLKNKKCEIRSISCKFFMCYYVENKMKKYNKKTIIPLMFLNKYQLNIMKTGYFKDRETIINEMYLCYNNYGSR